MAGARQMTMAVVALVACLALLVQVSSAAVSHVVGDATGWTKPPSSTFYNSWASNQPPFNIGDFLVFNFPGATQTVAEVTKPAYDSCSAAAPITQMNNGPVNITITTPGTHYYISTDSGHCSAGQKFAITVASGKAPPPTATTPPGTKPSPAAPAPKSSTPSTPSGAMTPAASPAGKGSMAPSTTPTTPSTGAMTPAASPAGKGSMAPSATPTTPSTGGMTPAASPSGKGAMTPAATPMAAPVSPAMSPMTAPAGAAPAPESGTPMGGPMAPSEMTPSAGGPSVSSPRSPSAGGMSSPAMSPGSGAESAKGNSASAVGAAQILPLLLLVGSNLLLF